jgi:putative hydrolase of the HAD superfamily
MKAQAVTFDAGQTLIELDTGMLSARLAERGHRVAKDALDAAQPLAWRHYERSIQAGQHEGQWQVFMATLLARAGRDAGIDEARVAWLADWLWTEQPAHNLWRRPIAGMFELARDLTGRGIPVGILSNSEGRLAELIAEIGWSAPFRVIVDSGRLGIAKPDRRIFETAAESLGVPLAAVVHIGDSRTADVDGARAVGMRVIWFGPTAIDLDDSGVAPASNADEVRAILTRWGLFGAG